MGSCFSIVHKAEKVLRLCKKFLLLFQVGQLYHYTNQTSLKTKSLTQSMNYLLVLARYHHDSIGA